MLCSRSKSGIGAVFFCLVFVFTLGIQTAIAQEDAVTLINNGKQAVSESEWTAEDFENAQPAMPTVDPADVDLEEIAPDAEADGPSQGQPPSKGHNKDARSLMIPTSDPNSAVPFLEQDAEETDAAIEPAQAGTQRAFFSSQRLLPRRAALSWPYRVVGKLFFKNQDGASFVCSASIIQRRLIVTAGHCVHNGNGQTSGFFNSFRFIPAFGARKNGDQPWGTWNWRALTVSNAWFSGGGTVPNSDDYAIIELRDKRIGGRVWRIGSLLGWFGWHTLFLHPNHAHILGYPCNIDSCRQMHQVTSESWRRVSPNNVSYGSDMRGGSSGGPFVQNFGTSRNTATIGTIRAQRNRVIGVVSWGFISLRPQVQGASTFDGTFVSMWNFMCGLRAGNCKK